MRLFITILFFIGGALFQAQAAGTSTGRIIIYLEKTLQLGASFTVQFNAIELVGEYSRVSPVPIVHSVSGDVLSQRQILLGESDAEAGRYGRLILSVQAQMDVRSPADSSETALFSGELEVPLDIDVFRGVAETVFLQIVANPTANDSLIVNIRAIEKTVPPETSLAYVSNEESGTVTVIDRLSGEVVASVLAGGSPRGMAIARNRGLLFTANGESNSVSVIDIRNQQLREVIALDFGDAPEALCLSTDESTLFTANQGSNSVTVIELASLHIINKVSVGTAPVEIATDPWSGSVYTVNSLSDNVTIINPGDVTDVKTVSCGSRPVAVEMALRSRKAYIANYNSGNITVLNTESLTVEGWLNSTRSIRDLVLDPFSEMLYCVIEQLNSVTLLKERLNIDIAEVLTEAQPFRASFDPERSYLYVINRETDSVTIINKTLRRMQGSIATGRKPYAILFP